jgi:methylase of polypeptide subunit release factors
MEDLFGNTPLKQAYKELDFEVLDDSDRSPVVPVDRLYSNSNNLSPYQIFALSRAKQIGVTAVYFRYFENRPPQPQIYIIDKSDGLFSESSYAETHRNIWSSCEVPICMVITMTELRIYDCRKPVSVQVNGISIKPEHRIPIDRLAEYAHVLEAYNATKFDNGSFWDGQEASRKFLYNKSAYHILTSKLKAVREGYKSNSKLDDNLSDRLLITCILIKYLEENGVDEEGVNQAVNFFREKTGQDSLLEIIRAGNLILLLNELAEHFNGGIFKFSPHEKKAIENSNFSKLTSFLDESLDANNQLFLWKQFSFKYIPVELISNFYEEFLPREDVRDSGAVYTPSYLVELLVDQVLPLSSTNAEYLNENIKLIDVSCGSGIFLVVAYKRLVQRYMLSQWMKKGTTEITSAPLLKILKNIHGVDRNEKAVNLTLFSLSLAVCSFLSPKKIWTELKFENLITSENIETADFFDWVDTKKFNKFDLVIGNPPFKDLKEEDFAVIRNTLERKSLKIDFRNPKRQLALVFLEIAMNLLKPEKLLCLIIPSGPLLYFDDSLPFRKDFFGSYNVPQLFDFTYLRRILFQATVPVAAVFAEKTKPTEEEIVHVVFKRTKSVAEKQHFEIDHYDTFTVPKASNAEDLHSWKYNLVGGNYVKALVERLKDMYPRQTIKDFLSWKVKEHNWTFGPAKNAKLQPNLFLFANRITDGKFPILLTRPQINSETYSVSAPHNDKDAFLKFKNLVIADGPLYSFYIAATSGRQALRGPYTIVPGDFHVLPYVGKHIKLTKTEKIIVDDVTRYRVPEFGSGEESPINDDVLLTNKAGNLNKVFVQFGDVFSDVLNFFYEKRRRKYCLSDVYEGKSFFVCVFNFTSSTSHPRVHATDENISTLLKHKAGRNLYINRVARVYNDYQIILIKPKQMRYWLRSIALRDADETIEDVLNGEQHVR